MLIELYPETSINHIKYFKQTINHISKVLQNWFLKLAYIFWYSTQNGNALYLAHYTKQAKIFDILIELKADPLCYVSFSSV